jgi:hypothetical protein
VFIWTLVAPGLRVEQIALRLGMLPTTPACDQSTARLGLTTPDQSWACEHIPSPSKIRGKRKAWRLILPRCRPRNAKTGFRNFNHRCGRDNVKLKLSVTLLNPCSCVWACCEEFYREDAAAQGTEVHVNSAANPRSHALGHDRPYHLRKPPSSRENR